MHEFPSFSEVGVNEGLTGFENVKIFTNSNCYCLPVYPNPDVFCVARNICPTLTITSQIGKSMLLNVDSSVPGKAILEQTVRSIFQFFGNGHRHGDEVS